MSSFTYSRNYFLSTELVHITNTEETPRWWRSPDVWGAGAQTKILGHKLQRVGPAHKRGIYEGFVCSRWSKQRRHEAAPVCHFIQQAGVAELKKAWHYTSKRWDWFVTLSCSPVFHVLIQTSIRLLFMDAANVLSGSHSQEGMLFFSKGKFFWI